MHLPFRLIIVLLASSLLSNAQQGEVAKSAALIDRAKGFVELLVKEDASSVVKHFDKTMKEALLPKRIPKVWKSLIAQV